MSKRGKLIVVSGPSGSGKGTILGEVLKSPDFVYSISMTTRAPREGEIDGKHYFFVDKASFEEDIKKNRFIEYAEYNHNYYGTPKDFVEMNLASGRNVILEIEVQGAMQIKKTVPDALFIFMTPESRFELEERLRSRGTEDEDVICRRLAIADREIHSAFLYDYIIINENGKQEKAVKDFKAAIRANNLTSFHQYDILKKYFS
ncbi:MAG: guanylate kinase [Ruminococcaceae bacterium]|nr:guanylate kinase [Oscillospiraceae bacterium]